MRYASIAALILTGAPIPVQAQKGIEFGVHGMATLADFSFAGSGVAFGIRPGGRARFVIAATPGAIEGGFAFRGEAMGQFLLNPRSERRGFYAGGGLAGLTGSFEEGYLLLVLGVESSPGGRSGWMIEAGIGGGVRLMLGYRLRKLKR